MVAVAGILAAALIALAPVPAHPTAARPMPARPTLAGRRAARPATPAWVEPLGGNGPLDCARPTGLPARAAARASTAAIRP